MQIKNFIRNNLIAGVLITAPLGASIFLVLYVIRLTDKFQNLIPAYIRPETYLGFEIPGLGLVIAFIFLLVVGMLGRIYFIRFLLGVSEKMIQKIPLMAPVYSSVKQLLDTVVVTQSKEKKQKVVMVEFPRKGLYSLGFLTSVAKGEAQIRTKENVVNVFVPTTPNPTSGFFIMVPETDLIYMDMSVEDAFKLIMSGGIVSPPYKGDTHQLSA